MINKVKILLTMLFLAGFLALSCDNSCCAEEAPEVKEKVTLTGVSVVSPPTKMLYVAGEKFEPAGMLVKAHYSDGKEKELKDGEYTYSPAGVLTENNTNITVSYTEDGVKKETAVSIKMGYNITVAECENGTVECDLTRAEGKRKDGVPVKVTPDKGYYLTSLSYKYNDSKNEPNIFNIPVKENKNEYSFDMPFYDITIEAVFAEDPTPRYSIELNKIGEKDQAVVTFIYGSVNSEEVVQKDIFEGTEITFTVSPNSEDYYVPEIPQIAYNGETKDVEVVDLNTGKYKFNMPGANVVVNVAIAKWGTYKLSTNVNGGKGTVKLTADGKEIVGDTFLAVGTEIKAVVTPADDYEISFVKFNSEVLDADDDGSYTFKMGEENAALEVMFAEIQGNEVVQGAVVNGKLEISHVLAKPETNVTITAIPDEGYVAVESLKVTTADSAATEIPYQKVSESGNVYSFVMPESAVTVSAVFRGYLVTVNTSENGKVTADVASAKAGDKITLTAIATEKNALGAISVKAGEDSLKNTRTDLESGKAEITFTMPASDVEIDATFDKAVSVTAGYTPENDAGLIELYQGKTYITLGNTMYFANGTELTLETTPGTIGDGIYEVGAVKAIAANDQSSLNLVTEVTANEEYKIVVEDRNFEILVEFTLSNAKRVFINKEGLVGGTVVVEDNGTTVTSSSDSWLGGDAYIIDGHTVTVKATADVGYTVGTIKWNGKTITNGGEFSMPAEQVEITATFEKDSYPLNFKSSVANGKFTLSSDFTFDADKGILSPAGKTYGNGDKVPYKEIVYIIATPSNSDYMEQITVMNETEGQAIRLDRLNTVSKPYQFEMPASASGVTANISFEFAGSDVNLWVNGSPVTSFYLNPSPDKATWGTLEKEYYIRYKNAEGFWCQGYPLKKGDKVQIKDKNGNPLNSYEYALGFDETNPNYNMATSTYTAEGDGVYKMYYKLWGDGSYSMWIQIPKTGALADADYFFTLNGQKVEKLAVTVSLTQKEIDSGIVKQFYIKNVDLQKGDSVGIETNASAIPDDGILHWEHGEDEKGNDWNKLISRENDGKPFKIPAAGEYDFYFKVWQDGGTSIWIEESKPVVTP